MTPAATYGADYKDAAPATTVTRIKNILTHLGIEVRETMFQQGDVAYSCRITICNKGLEQLNIGTNGKGLTPEYALASGYAELMERLQNKFLINEAMRFAGYRPGARPMEFRFFPDEKITESDSRWYLREYLPMIFPRMFSGHSHHHAAWTHSPDNTKVRWRAVEYAVLTLDGPCHLADMPVIPVRANSSTGMCAGNTPAEAIVQGICEVFERYVLQMIYCRPITPPSFPNGYFNSTEAGRRLAALQRQGYTYDVKDMSLGMGLPVVGLILTNTANGTTMFRLGSDLNPGIALERCITETFQGRQCSQDTFADYSASADLSADPTRLRAEYRKSLKDGTGHYRSELFGITPSYQFSWPGLRRSGNSRTDLRNVVSLIDSLGLKLYVRDNSFLGFCAYHVYIPGLSEQEPALMPVMDDYLADIRPAAGNVMKETDTIWPLYDIAMCDNPAGLARFIEQKYPTDTTIKLAPYNVSPRNRWNRHLLVALLAIKGGDYAKGSEAFRLFLDNRAEAGMRPDPYLECVHHYLICKSAGLPEDRIAETLSCSFAREVTNEVMSDMKIPSRVMDNYSLPTCFRCDVCPLTQDCRFEAVAAMERRLQHEQTANPIDQSLLFTLL